MFSSVGQSGERYQTFCLPSLVTSCDEGALSALDTTCYTALMNGETRDLVVKPPVQLLFAAVAIGGLFYVAGQYIASQPQRIQQEAEAKREIAVQGRGEVSVRPDVAKVTLGLTTGPQPTAKAALDALAKKFQGIVAAVKNQGIKDEDVKTSNFSIQPVYDFADGRQTIRGFEATESLEVKIRDLDKIGEVLARTTAEGVNQAGGISFEIDDPDAAQDEAEGMAIKDAKANAERLAKTLGVGLGRVKTFSVTSAPPSPGPIFAQAELEGVPGAGGPGAPPVPPGIEEIVVTVTVTYELR